MNRAPIFGHSAKLPLSYCDVWYEGRLPIPPSQQPLRSYTKSQEIGGGRAFHPEASTLFFLRWHPEDRDQNQARGQDHLETRADLR